MITVLVKSTEVLKTIAKMLDSLEFADKLECDMYDDEIKQVFNIKVYKVPSGQVEVIRIDIRKATEPKNSIGE